jgi:guanylate cyclase
MAITTSLKSAMDAFYRLGHSQGDSDEVRLQKSCLVAGTVMTAAAGVIWGVSYFLLGAHLAGIIPLGYSVVSMAAFLYFCRTRRYQVLRGIQLALILLLPFLLMAALGGLVSSSLVNIWALTCPLTALFFSDRKTAPRWLAAYLVLLVASGFAQPYFAPLEPMPPPLVLPFFIVNVGTVSVITFLLLSYFIGQKNQAFGLLRKEQDRSESLLLNVLPPEVAERLKKGERTIADHYDCASILFADLVGFTPLSKELPPIAMVELLNEVYSVFDSLVVQYGVEKIRTIGDNYMVAAGVPTPRGDHAEALANLALDMLASLDRRRWAGEPRLSFRIGINTGPVIAGVIGHKKFTYDVWGDAVNIASRMESQGVPGMIQITRSTYERIKDRFRCAPNGTIAVKGGGEMETWFLTGRAKP